jgi:hypothetical protein
MTYIEGWEPTGVGPSVTVGESGFVAGTIFAEFVRIAGRVEGPIEAMAVTVAATAHIVGHITHNTLTIEPGATLEGRRPWRPPNFLDGRRPWGESEWSGARKRGARR